LPGVEYDWQLHICRGYHLARLPENGLRLAKKKDRPSWRSFVFSN
jgi:hypothetical protein